jgi:hypothetical protein
MISSSPVYALYATEQGKSIDARSACWHVLIPQLLTFNVGELVIESMEGLEARDRRDIGDALRKPDQMGSLSDTHRSHGIEPIL